MDMQDLSIYEDLKNGDYQAPSIYLAAMKTPLANPTPAVVRERLEKILQRADVDEILAVEADDDSDFIHIVISGGHEDWDETENFLFRVHRRLWNAKPISIPNTSWAAKRLGRCNWR